ncbi:MAG: DUF1835 domain-containing protein [Gaiellaceae bacterium MAG52_C11]|nr:DUF1835 domain-containing protein [Candidatus Gaiellasilicea maunaloa]
MLHVTNGDSACVLIERIVDGDVIAWRDALHEGPVPDVPPDELRRVRARFLAECGWSDESPALRELEERDAAVVEALELCLWFEHDLYDQLQLLQVLALARGPVELVQSDRFLAELAPDELGRLYESRRPLDHAQRALAARAWAAFRAPEPTALAELVDDDTAALPFLGAALRRHLDQLPDRQSGLARTERLVLDVVLADARTREDVFRSVQRLDRPSFMGDSALWLWLERLEPLIGREPFELTPRAISIDTGAERWRTPARWLGGIRLQE